MGNDRQHATLRKVAILIASLDTRSGERVLSGLSPSEARLVREQLDQLSDIDPEEQEEVVAQFKRSLDLPHSPVSTGVEVDASLLERIDHQDYTNDATPSQQNPLEAIAQADLESLAEMLSDESLQTIAVVISRLDTDRAAEVLRKFPVEQQTGILNRLEQLGETDEHSVEIIDAQINQWLSAHRQRRERMAAGKQMVERLLSRAAASTDERLTISTKMPRIAPSPAAPYDRSMRSQRQPVLPTLVRFEPIPRVAEPTEPSNPFTRLSAAECAERLEQLPDDLLARALSQADSYVISLALVGASEKLTNRLIRKLPRSDQKQFKQHLRDIGPTRLSDILASQQEILHIASQLV